MTATKKCFSIDEACVQLSHALLYNQRHVEDKIPKVIYNKANKHISVGDNIFVGVFPRRKDDRFEVVVRLGDNARTINKYNDFDDAVIAVVAVYNFMHGFNL